MLTLFGKQKTTQKLPVLGNWGIYYFVLATYLGTTIYAFHLLTIIYS